MALKVGIVRDDRYLLHQPGLVHPERAERLKAVYRMLDTEFPEALISIQPELVSLEHLELVHSPNYVRKVLRTSERKVTFLAPDTPVSSQSYLAAYLAVGGCIRGLQALLSGRCDICFALVRPPGHHAMPNRAGGFCIFNNLGVTARYAMKRHGMGRILIVDWDIHHGNGIQDLFYAEKEVVYFSSHFMGWYPQTGHWEETGRGDGLGYTINLEVPKDIDDSDMVGLYGRILHPLVRSFQPELILVAAGFDAHHLDPVGRGKLTETSFRNLTQLVMELAEGQGDIPVLLALEGGYEVTALVSCVKAVLDVMVMSGPRAPLTFSLSRDGQELFDKAYSIHEQYGVWTDV